MKTEYYKNLIIRQKSLNKTFNALIRNLKNKNLKPYTLYLKPKNGFTLVELLVAMTLFIVIVGVSTGSFIKILQTQRATVSLIAANSNAALTMETITKEIRTGRDFSVEENGDLLFTNSQKQAVAYHWDSAAQALEKSVDGENFKKLTADNVLVTRASFLLFEGDPEKPFPPRITTALTVSATGLPFKTPVINLQMTVSARTY